MIKNIFFMCVFVLAGCFEASVPEAPAPVANTNPAARPSVDNPPVENPDPVAPQKGITGKQVAMVAVPVGGVVGVGIVGHFMGWWKKAYAGIKGLFDNSGQILAAKNLANAASAKEIYTRVYAFDAAAGELFLNLSGEKIDGVTAFLDAIKYKHGKLPNLETLAFYCMTQILNTKGINEVNLFHIMHPLKEIEGCSKNMIEVLTPKEVKKVLNLYVQNYVMEADLNILLEAIDMIHRAGKTDRFKELLNGGKHDTQLSHLMKNAAEPGKEIDNIK